ncbi:hypothetical protein AB3N04_06880 [Alkalihalophilus sp. As8PL]|uniref:DUF4352 domain-containing protein n=1 Tax=Alkalihalophilus sp. As8PL TaxID=3237103 RepID=A0AB39BWF7_9BACI
MERVEETEEATEVTADAEVEATEEEEEEETEESEGKSDVGTRDNPLAIGERVTVEYNDLFYGNVSLDVELLEVISGDEAAERVQDGNPFNEEAGENEEYVLAKFYVKAHEIEEEPFDLNHAQFDAVSSTGNAYDGFISVSGLEPDLSNELYSGAEREGYTYFLVDKDDENPLAAFKRRTDAELWFQLRAE